MGNAPNSSPRADVFQRWIKRPHRFIDPSTDTEVNGTIEDALALTIIAAGCGGDVAAAREAFDSAYGKTALASAPDELPDLT